MEKVFICVLMLLLASCSIFEKQEQLLQTVKSINGKVINLYYIGLGATTNDVIQIRKMVDSDKEIILHSYEHNFVNSAQFITEDSLMVVMSDTTVYGLSKKVDTIRIIIR